MLQKPPVRRARPKQDASGAQSQREVAPGTSNRELGSEKVSAKLQPRMDPWQSPSPSAADTEDTAAEGTPDTHSSAPVSLVEKVEQLSQFMPILARTEVPCADAVFATSCKDAHLQPHLSRNATVAEHLQVFSHPPQQAGCSTTLPAVIRQIWGVPDTTPVVAVADTPTDTDKDSIKEKRRSLASMPAGRITRDFVAVQRFTEQLPQHGSGSAATAAGIVCNAIWKRTLTLPGADPARVWEHVLTQPAALFARARASQGRWETGRCLRELARSQGLLEQWGKRRTAAESAAEAMEASPASVPRGEGVQVGARCSAAQRTVWEGLCVSATDAEGLLAVRTAWAAMVGLAKLAKVKSSRLSAWEKASPALVDLQQAVRDMGPSKLRAEVLAWGDLAGQRTALYRAASSVRGLSRALCNPSVAAGGRKQQWAASPANTSRGTPQCLAAASCTRIPCTLPSGTESGMVAGCDCSCMVAPGSSTKRTWECT
jgi:hypothetical protein